VTSQDKLAVGMIIFLVFFVLAFLVVPPSVYRQYFSDLERRRKQRLVKPLIGCIFLLSLPYFYDQLVGLDNPWISRLLGIVMGACAYFILIDVAWFAYQNYGPPSQRPGRSHK
jgi:amino acid transporter